MNVRSKGILFLCVVLFCASSVFSFSVCNVDISEPWFVVNDSSGVDVLIVDSQGDTYFEGQDHSLNNQNSQESFVVGDQHYNAATSKFASVSEGVSSLGSGDGLVVRNAAGVDVAKFTETSFSTKGAAVYEGSQAGCSPDGAYCLSPTIEETRNYFCDLTASKAGICTHSVLSSRACNTLDYYYCSASVQYMKQTHACADSEGGCYPLTPTLIENCEGLPTDYGSWSCYSETKKVRTNIEYSPTCSSAGGCDVSSATVSEYENCPSNYYCSSGTCYPCQSHSSYKCSEGNIYWYDNCGHKEDEKESCPDGCTDGKTRCDKVVTYQKDHEQFIACEQCGWFHEPHTVILPFCISPPFDTTSTYDCGNGYTTVPNAYWSNYVISAGVLNVETSITGEGSCQDARPGVDRITYSWLCRSDY
ncbi:hypothetical protein H6501_03820 [Candidatus Woesearchaeota archaeon]|nr:hypothetical protein [Candidatus Woesearchaeota archaeon]